MRQRVFELGAANDKNLSLGSEVVDFNLLFIAEPMMETWTPPPNIPVHDKKKRLRDFVSWTDQAPVISEKARTTLEPLIGAHCEILPLVELRGGQYFAVNVLTLLDCVDRANSGITYDEDDPSKVRTIWTFSFREEKIPPEVPLFKVPEYRRRVFVQQPFIDAVIAHNLGGASFMDPGASIFRKIARGEPLNVVPGVPD